MIADFFVFTKIEINSFVSISNDVIKSSFKSLLSKIISNQKALSSNYSITIPNLVINSNFERALRVAL